MTFSITATSHDRHGVSNHWWFYNLFNYLFRLTANKISKRRITASPGNPPATRKVESVSILTSLGIWKWKLHICVLTFILSHISFMALHISASFWNENNCVLRQITTGNALHLKKKFFVFNNYAKTVYNIPHFTKNLLYTKITDLRFITSLDLKRCY